MRPRLDSLISGSGNAAGACVVGALLCLIAGSGPAAAAPNGVTRSIALSATSLPQTGSFTPSGLADATHAEFAAQLDTAAGPGPFPGTIVGRHLSTGTGEGASVRSLQMDTSNLAFEISFDGLNHYQQRYARGGNQFSVEPPDQGLCVGNGYVLELVNDVLNVYNTSGQSVLPDNTATNIVAGYARNVDNAIDLNSFYGYAPAIDRSTGIRAQSVTDPSCLYDAATQRFFVVVLTLESKPDGTLTHVNHLDIAVSATSNPTGAWNIYHLDVTNDGSNPDPSNACPCVGDYPHIGADAYGIYVTTNSYPWNGNGFDGAQIYAFSKTQLAAGATRVTAVHLDTFGTVPVPSDAGPTQPGFTVWPAQSPNAKFDTAHEGTEFFMSSNAADEATHPIAGTAGNHMSHQIVVWTLKNTSSLNTSTPELELSNRVVTVQQYAIPPTQKQPDHGELANEDAPLGHCINDTTTPIINGLSGCWTLLFAKEPAHNEVISTPDSNDTRMQQVMYANGKLWGALDTAINPDGGQQRAGIAYYIVNPDSGTVVLQGYLGAEGYDFTYPAIGVTEAGRGVMAFTATGDGRYPSAAYAPIDAVVGTGAWKLAGPGGRGSAVDDGFTSYNAYVGAPPRTRWGDFGSAAVDGNSIWIASEYIDDRCDYTTWAGPYIVGGTGDNLLGTCAGAPGATGTRSALANWATRISKLSF
jgi:hypothetical protein